MKYAAGILTGLGIAATIALVAVAKAVGAVR